MRQAGRCRRFVNIPTSLSQTQKHRITPKTVVRCHRAYGMDGIIMFSDILALPCLGIEFDVVRVWTGDYY
jgi:uroporphyrinogen-III decarboxylase